MFAPIGRQLAFVNALVIAFVVAVVGVSALAVLRNQIERQTRDTIIERALAAGTDWTPLLATGQPIPATSASTDSLPATTEPGETHGNELVESGDTVLLGFDRTGALAANPRGLRLTGLPFAEGVTRALHGFANTKQLQLDDGETVDIYTMPLKSDGRIVGSVQAIQGRSEHDQTMRLLGLVLAVSAGLGIFLAAPAGLFLARRAMRPIDRAFERQRTFVADAAHELRTPLTVLRANAELIVRLPDIARADRTAELSGMVAEIDDMNRLVTDLLDLARADAGRIVANKTCADLYELIRDAVAAMQPLAQDAHLTLTIETSVPILANVDTTRIRQLMRVLVDNAITYTSTGGSVRVWIERDRTKATIGVQDSGIGIPLEEQEHVFRRFYRTDHARSRSTGGTGLGLSIAHAIAVAHGGTIALESTPDEGTTVQVTIPMGDSGNRHFAAPETEGANEWRL